MSSIIIGTAGHIDHGKTAIIRALNGFEGDSTDEEKRRAITINLSFSNLKRGEDNIAFIDVPGHESLIKTMVSGAYQMDAVMLVVAADDGVMPQTTEHIAALGYLGVEAAVVVANKCDLVSEERANEVLLAASELAQKHGISVISGFLTSTKTGQNIDELRDYLFNIKPKKHDEKGILRYYIDRIFNIKGHGCVVTGGILRGSVKEGEAVQCLELNKNFAIRSLQIHDNAVKSATAPARAALNLTGPTERLKTGLTLAKAGFYRGFSQIDCEASGELPHGLNAVLCVGAKQVSVKTIKLSDNFYSFKSDEPLFLEFGERFVVLNSGRVAGGGRVLAPIFQPLKKRDKIALLNALKNGDFEAAFRLLASIHKHGFGLISAQQQFGIKSDEALAIAAKMADEYFVDTKEACIYGEAARRDIDDFIRFIISKNSRAMLSPTSLSLKLPWASYALCSSVLGGLLNRGVLDEKNGIFIKKGGDFEGILKSGEEAIFRAIDCASPLAPYNIYDELDIDRAAGDAVLKSLTKSKKAIRLAHNLFISAQALSQITAKMREIITKEGGISVGSLKERLNISRKYAICYLEYLDQFGDIKNEQNVRTFI